MTGAEGLQSLWVGAQLPLKAFTSLPEVAADLSQVTVAGQLVHHSRCPGDEGLQLSTLLLAAAALLAQLLQPARNTGRHKTETPRPPEAAACPLQEEVGYVAC